MIHTKTPKLSYIFLCLSITHMYMTCILIHLVNAGGHQGVNNQIIIFGAKFTTP